MNMTSISRIMVASKSYKAILDVLQIQLTRRVSMKSKSFIDVPLYMIFTDPDVQDNVDVDVWETDKDIPVYTKEIPHYFAEDFDSTSEIVKFLVTGLGNCNH